MSPRCSAAADHTSRGGILGGLSGEVDVEGDPMDILYPFLDCRAFTIYGGSSQVQRNILAKNVLDLPS